MAVISLIHSWPLNNMGLNRAGPLIHGFFFNKYYRTTRCLVAWIRGCGTTEAERADRGLEQPRILVSEGRSWNQSFMDTEELLLLPFTLLFFLHPSKKYRRGNKNTTVSWRSVMCQELGWNLDMPCLIHPHTALRVKHYYSHFTDEKAEAQWSRDSFSRPWRSQDSNPVLSCFKSPITLLCLSWKVLK